MFSLVYASDEEAAAATAVLRALGGRARNLLAECVEHQGIKRSKLSQIIIDLENAGFIFVTETDSVFDQEIHIRPSLDGEDALEMLEQIDGKDPKNKVRKNSPEKFSGKASLGRICSK